MVDVIAASAGITADDLDNAPFTERGGVDGALRDLGDQAGDLGRGAERGAHRVTWQGDWRSLTPHQLSEEDKSRLVIGPFGSSLKQPTIAPRVYL